MTSLKSRLVKIYSENNIISAEDCLKLYLESKQPEFEYSIKNYQALFEKVLLKVPNIIKDYLSPEHVTIAVRVPLKVNVSKPRFVPKEIYEVDFNYNNIPVVKIPVTHSLPEKHTYKTLPTSEREKEIFRKEVDSKFNELYLNKVALLKEKFQEEFEELVIAEIKKSGIKYSIKQDKYKTSKWLLLSVDKTKAEKVAPEYKEAYNKLMEAFYK